MTSIAEIVVPDSRLARDACALAREHSPAFLLTHCQRTYLFGALATRSAGLQVREELAYIAAILHDLGLTDSYTGQHRFEVSGANAAREWAIGNGLSDEEVQIIWDAIALHTSVGIAALHSPEAALVHWGAGIDVMGPAAAVIGPAAQAIDPNAIKSVIAALPREGFTSSFADLLEATATRTPLAYAMTWLADTARRSHNGPFPSSEDLAARREPFTTVS